MMRSNNTILAYLAIAFYLVVLTGCEPPISGSNEANPFIIKSSLELGNDRQLDYWLLLPENFDSTETYPAVLAIPPGKQSFDEIEWAINLYYIRQSIQRNWLVISPAAPQGIKFHEGSESTIPLLFSEIEKNYHIEESRYHLAGISNGGISAFRLGTLYPGRFQSITVFPGMPTETDKNRLQNLAEIPVTMNVGALDATEWVAETEQTVRILDSLGIAVSYKKWENDGHVIIGLTAAYLFDLFEEHRP